MKIATIIPTFNRKDLLVECIEAVTTQSYRPAAVYIMDNNSSDGTGDIVKQAFGTRYNGVDIHYINMGVNGGGAMGFSVGMETAFNDADYDAFWMMDDDGLPKSDCLEILCRYLSKYDYVCPRVMNRYDRDKLCGRIDGSYNPEKLLETYGGKEIMEGYCNPFNGALYSRKLVEKVGFPKKELFIYGDEINYHLRAKMAGFNSVGIYSAVHYHPPYPEADYKRFAGVVNFKPSPLPMFCQWRNAVYNKLIRFSKQPIFVTLGIIRYFAIHVFFFSFVERSYKWLKIFLQASTDGLRSRWGGEKKYLSIK